MNEIRAITFDLDDTLWDNRPVLLAAERTLHDWLEVHYPRIPRRYSIESMREMRLELLRRRPMLGHSMTELRKASLRQAADAVGYDHSLVEPAFRVLLEARHRITLFDDVVPSLRRLRHAGYTLGSMTNGNADVHRLGIGGLFDFSLSAESVGRAKPEPDMFEAACRHAAVAPEQLVHVGDDPATDLIGARQAGVRVIWMNRLQQPMASGVTADAVVSSMTELLRLFDPTA